MSEDSERPALRVVRGAPTEEEVAALVGVLAARGGSDGEQPAPRRRSAWGDPARAVRTPMHPGPDGWRRSALPR